MTSPRLLSPQSAYGRLLALATAATSKRAADYGLRFSVLLQGKRGIGKFTTAIWVAHTLGYHVLEVSGEYLRHSPAERKTRSIATTSWRKMTARQGMLSERWFKKLLAILLVV